MPYDPNWKNTPGTQAPTPTPGAWNAGDVWDMNRAPQDVVDSMKKYAETHDEKYYKSQIPTPAGSGLVAPPDVASGHPNAKLVGPGTGSTSPWYDASGVKHQGSPVLTGWSDYLKSIGFTTTPTETAPTTLPNTVPVTTAPIIPPTVTTHVTTPAVTPPATSPLSTNLLVTQPGATAAQNTIASLQNLLGRSAVGGVGSFKMPDFFKQTQQKWGGFSPAAFGKR